MESLVRKSGVQISQASGKALRSSISPSRRHCANRQAALAKICAVPCCGPFGRLLVLTSQYGSQNWSDGLAPRREVNKKDFTKLLRGHGRSELGLKSRVVMSR